MAGDPAGKGQPCAWIDPFGACCFPDGSCQELSGYDCPYVLHNALLCEHVDCEATAVDATELGKDQEPLSVRRRRSRPAAGIASGG